MSDKSIQREDKKKELNVKNLKMILFGVVALQFIGIAATMVFLRSRGGSSGGGDSSDSGSFVPFLPIWVAVFVPLLARRKKEQTEEEKKKMLLGMLALAVLVLIGIVTFLFVSMR